MRRLGGWTLDFIARSCRVGRGHASDLPSIQPTIMPRGTRQASGSTTVSRIEGSAAVHQCREQRRPTRGTGDGQIGRQTEMTQHPPAARIPTIVHARDISIQWQPLRPALPQAEGSFQTETFAALAKIASSTVNELRMSTAAAFNTASAVQRSVGPTLVQISCWRHERGAAGFGVG